MNRLPNEVVHILEKSLSSHNNKKLLCFYFVFKSSEGQSCSGPLQCDVDTKLHENPPVVTTFLECMLITFTSKPSFLIKYEVNEGGFNE
jgi:hypothetical protein